MQFTAYPYEVEVTRNGESIRLPVFNAEGVFKSIKLDELKEKITLVINEYNKFRAEFEALPEDKKNDPAIIAKITSISKTLRFANVDYMKECIKDIDKHESLIDEIVPSEMQYFMSAIERAMFGHTDNDVKKKIRSAILSRNSSGGTTRKRKSKAGHRSK